MGTCRLGELFLPLMACKQTAFPLHGVSGICMAAMLQAAVCTATCCHCCCAGADPTSSALDPAGECWDVPGLYCMDGSTLPTPTGVNPMIRLGLRRRRGQQGRVP
jgi:choline dehydrogenase-like flavoprotein